MRTLLVAALLALLSTTAVAKDMDKKSGGAEAGVAKLHETFFGAWNQHDVKSMVNCWADDATLINPVGRVAHGKTEIEALLNDEQTTVFKTSTAKVEEMKITRSLGSNLVLFDGEIMVSGAVGTDGATLPDQKMHLAGIAEKKGANWVILDARPYAFLAPLPAKAN